MKVKVPEKQILERSKPEKNNPPNLGPKNVKKLELPHPPRLIKKAKRQKKYPSVRNGDQLPITNFLRGVPTPDDSSSRQQVKVIGTATPGSGPGLRGAAPGGAGIQGRQPIQNNTGSGQVLPRGGPTTGPQGRPGSGEDNPDQSGLKSFISGPRLRCGNFIRNCV